MAFAWTLLMFLVIQVGHSYILLTANLDDVHTIAKQMVGSPVASQLKTILRRASNLFNQQLRTGNNGKKGRFLRSQHQSDSTFAPIQDNHIERRNHQGHQPHRRRQSGSEDNREHHSYRFEDSQNLTKSYSEETRDQDHTKHESLEGTDKSRPTERDRLKENYEAQGEGKGKDNQEETHERSEELEDRRKESRLSEERDDEKPEDDDIKVVRHENREKDARSNSDEVITLAKNASFYLNSIKKIMETV